MKRRNFLSKGLAAITGSVALPYLGCKGTAPKEGEAKPKLMYRTLGKTGVKLPIVSMGSMEASSEALVRTALDSGIAHIATSHYYQRGKVQQFIGRIIKDYERDKILLATGKTRFLGAASHSFVAEAVRAVADSGFYDVVMPAYNFLLEDIEERTEAVDYAAGKGLGVVAMKTISGVSWLTGEKQEAVSNPKAALKWVLQNENIHTTVPGFTTFEQLEANLSIMEDLTLTPEEIKFLELARMNQKQSLLCQGCGTCLKQCSSAPDIPTLMRCYMYAYGYRDLALAVRNLKSVKDDPIACTNCTSCVVNCRMGFNVKERALDIIRIRDFPQEFFS